MLQIIYIVFAEIQKLLQGYKTCYR